MNVYCDHCGAKRCVVIVGTDSRMMFTKNGVFEGVKIERIEQCPYRDETRMIEVNFRNREEVKSTEKGTDPTTG